MLTLTQDERDELGTLLSGGKQAARKLKRAQILLARGRRCERRGDRSQRRRRRLDGVPHQAAVRGGQPGGGTERGAAPGR